MRAFVFVAAGARYAMDAAAIQAVHPLVRARPVPGAPPWLAGVIDVHGELVPLVDACLLLGNVPVGRTLGARVMLVDTGTVAGQTRARFALAVDRVLDPTDLDMDSAWAGGARAVPWLGSVVQHAGEAAQVFDACLLAQANLQLTAPPAPEARDALAAPAAPGGGAHP